MQLQAHNGNDPVRYAEVVTVASVLWEQPTDLWSHLPFPSLETKTLPDTTRVSKNLRRNRPWNLGENQVLLLTRKSIAATWPLTFWYTNRSVSGSAVIREVSCSTWKLSQRLTIAVYSEWETSQYSVLNGMSSPTLSPQRSASYAEEESEILEELEARDDTKKHCLQTQQYWYTHETAHTGTDLRLMGSQWWEEGCGHRFHPSQ